VTLEELFSVIEALEQEGVEYVVIGGAAVNAHGLVRATEDLDLMIRPTPENVDKLRRALKAVWDDPCIEEITYDDLGGDYPAVRYVPPDGEIYLDIVARFGEAWHYDDIEAQHLQIGPVVARVATPRALFRMKKNTVRDVDRADARALSARFGITEEDG
jgi:hypothetical protein